MSWSRVGVAFVAIALFARPALPHEGHEGPEVPDAERVSLPKEAQFLAGVLTETATRHPVRDRVSVQGQIVASAGGLVRLYPPNAGRIAPPPSGRLPLLGEPVRRGQLLGFVEILLTGEGLVFARPNRMSASAQARIQLIQFERDLASARARAAGASEVAAAERLVDAARERLTTAEHEAARLGGVGTPFERFPVTSPIDGVIAEADISPGDIVQTNRLLFTILDLSVVWAEARIYEVDLARLEGATEAEVTVDAYPGEHFEARRAAVAPQLDAPSRTRRVMFEVPNAEHELLPGMFARLAIGTSAVRTALTIPESAHVTDRGRSLAFVHTGPETFAVREVTLGGHERGQREVLRGIAPGERVVVRAADALLLRMEP